VDSGSLMILAAKATRTERCATGVIHPWLALEVESKQSAIVHPSSAEQKAAAISSQKGTA
jgi:hypothetical protein